MNKIISNLTTKIAGALCILSGLVFTSCSMEPDDVQPVKGFTIEDYIVGAEDLSSFHYILQRSGYDRVMASYGNYTCFAPTNEAVDKYLQELWNDEDAKILHNGMTAPTLEGLSDSLCKDISEFHLLGIEMDEAKLVVAEGKSSTITTMLGRSILLSQAETGEPVLNDSAMVVYTTTNEEKPNNGIVHKLNRVIPRSNRTVLNEMKKVWGDDYSIFIEALELAGFDEVLEISKKDKDKFEDAVTLGSDEGGFYYMKDVTECKIGYTVFAESDKVLKSQGIESLPDLIAHANAVYGNSAVSGGWYDYFREKGVKVTTPTSLEDESVYKDSCNALNMWLSYHIIKAAISPNLLTSDVSVWNQNGYKGDSYEYYETMLPKTLMKLWYVKSDSKYYINRYVLNNTLTDGLETLGSAAMHTVVKNGLVVNTANVLQPSNGYVYPIDGTAESGGPQSLEYKEYVPKNVLNERMRMDCFSFLYETMNNGIRGMYRDEIENTIGNGNGVRVRFPNDYFDNIKVYNGRNTTIDMTTRVKRTETGTSWCNYQGDGLQGRSEYDLAIKLPPVPAGTYELRIDVTLGGPYFGMTQYYLGRSSDVGKMVAVDLPIDLRMDKSDPRIGFTSLLDGSNYAEEWEEDKGLEVDKVMRTHGWMRGPLSIVMNSTPSMTRVQRFNGYCVRRIIVKQYFEQGDYWLRMKAVLRGNHKYQIDYVEFCPVTVADSEQYLEDMY